MSLTLRIEVPDDSLANLKASPEGLARQIVVAAAVKWYETRRLSGAQAAAMAGLSMREWHEALRDFEIPAPISNGPTRKKVTVDDVAGCLRYPGPAKTLEEMEDAVRQGVMERQK